jgi:hypothetical protein
MIILKQTGQFNYNNMEKKVILVGKKDCHYCEVLFYELVEIHKLKPFFIFEQTSPELFTDFSKHFGINRYPASQIDDGKDFITIHMDKDFKTDSSNYIFVESVGHMVDKTLELISK